MGSVVGRLLARLPEREQQLKRRRPLGIVKLVLQSIELEAPEAVFCVLKCVPHHSRPMPTARCMGMLSMSLPMCIAGTIVLHGC